MPSVNDAPASSRPETNCDDAEASISTAPPATDPAPRTRNGRPSPSTSTPRPRSAFSNGVIGRTRACSSPSNVTNLPGPRPIAASGGTKRNTVPARPQSIRASGAGAIVPLTASSSAGPWTRRPSVSSAPIIRSVSRLRSAPLIVETPPLVAASAASTKARLVWDFEPGTVTVAHTGVGADGAIQVLTGPSLLVCRLCHHGVMCGRFAVTTDPAALAEKIQAINEARSAESAAGPNYNVAPTTTITTVVRRHDEPDDQPSRRVRSMRWGLVPPWAKAGSDGAPESKGPQLINARAEKVTTSPAFRASAKSKRCLIPMDGYYEWRANGDTDSGKKARKTPFFLHRADGEMLFMAGLWSVWKPAKDATPLLSCTIITTDAVGGLAEIHDRMPLIVPARDWDRWLDPDAPPDLDFLAAPPSVDGIEMREISTLVNSTRNNGPELIEPAEPQPEQATLL